MLFVSLGNPNEDNSFYFEWSSLTKPCFINSFNQLKEATKTLLGVPTSSLFFLFDSRIRIRKGYAAETYDVLTAECQTVELSQWHIPRTVISWEMDFYSTL